MCYTVVTKINEVPNKCTNCGEKLSLSNVSDKEIKDYVLKHINRKHLSGVHDVSVCVKCKIVYLS